MHDEDAPGSPRAARTAVASRADDATAFQRLRTVASAWLPLRPLDPVEYAAGHALFEGRSDQREHVIDWLVQRLALRCAGPTRVLSIGCGDGTVDARVAAALATRGRQVDYTGVEPHEPSARAFAARLGRVPGVSVASVTESFEHARPEGSYDVVLAVHSLYYVADLATTLGRARRMLAPGGELIVLHAPLQPLNALVRLLAPGRPQAFGGEVAAHLDLLGRTSASTRIDSRLDLTTTGDAEVDRRLISFTVQAGLPPELLVPVRDALAERALSVPGLVVTHPLDAFVLTRPG